MTFYFGSHHSTVDGLINAAKEIKEAGGNLLQIFVTAKNRSTTRVRTNEEVNEIDEFKKYLKEHKMKVVVHSSYTHNFCRNWDSHAVQVNNLELEIKYAHEMGAFGVVVHFGKYLELSLQEAYNNMYSSLIYVHNKTKEYHNVKLLLETSAGQGTEICWKIEDLAYFYRKFSKNENKAIKDRFKLCVDSCHIFNSGYNISSKKMIDIYLETFEEMIGIRHIGLIHLNDSKNDVGSRLDRHERIGGGYIGYDGLHYFFNYFRKLKIPIILETPTDEFETEIKLLLHNEIL